MAYEDQVQKKYMYYAKLQSAIIGNDCWISVTASVLLLLLCSCVLYRIGCVVTTTIGSSAFLIF